MRIPSLIALFAFPILAVAQTTTAQGTQNQVSSAAGTQSAGNSANQTANVVLSTSFTTGVTLGSGRVESTFTSSVVFTITQQPTQTQSSGNSTNTNGSSNSSSSASSSTAPLPTATADIDGGGGGPGAAPFPGQATAGGAFGPPDNYISWADTISINALLSLVAGVGVGGALVLA